MRSQANKQRRMDRTIADRADEDARERQPARSSRPDDEVLNTLRASKRWSGALRLMASVSLIFGCVVIYGLFGEYYHSTPTLYRTQECRRGDLLVTVTATGTLDPTNVVDIGCEISGTIRTVAFDVNDVVSAETYF